MNITFYKYSDQFLSLLFNLDLLIKWYFVLCVYVGFGTFFARVHEVDEVLMNKTRRLSLEAIAQLMYV